MSNNSDTFRSIPLCLLDSIQCLISSSSSSSYYYYLKVKISK